MHKVLRTANPLAAGLISLLPYYDLLYCHSMRYIVTNWARSGLKFLGLGLFSKRPSAERIKVFGYMDFLQKVHGDKENL